MDFTGILEYSEYIIAITALLVFLCIYLPPNYRGWKNRRQPTITIRATVVGKDENHNNVIYSNYYTRDGGRVYMLTFDTEDHQRVSLTVPRDTYWLTEIGTAGVLTYQGTKCEKFTPDKPTEV